MAYTDNLSSLGIALIPRVMDYNTGNVAVRKAVGYSHPVRPYWTSPGSQVSKRGIALFGSDFIHQPSYTRADSEDDWALCAGNQTFQVFNLVVDDYHYPDNHTFYGEWTGTYAYNFLGPIGPNTLKPALTQDPAGIINGTFWPDSPQTATTANEHVEYEYTSGTPPVVVGTDVFDRTRTLREPVTRAWLLGEVGSWDSMSDANKAARGNATMSYTSSSSDGWRAAVSRADIKPTGKWFANNASGMTGNLATYWNGNFSTYAIKERRKNIPVARWRAPAVYTGAGRPSEVSGLSLYTNGHKESELSSEVTDKWVDSSGVFELAVGAAWDAALALTSYRSVNLAGATMAQGSALTGHIRGGAYGECNQLMLVSATGSRYRVTLEFGSSYPTFTVDETYVLETDAETLQVTHQFGMAVQYKTGRISRVEQWQAVGEGMGWVILSDIAAYDAWQAEYQAQYDAWQPTYWAWSDAWYAWDEGGQEGPEPTEPIFTPTGLAAEAAPGTPGSLVGTSPSVGIHVISVFKYRHGQTFGFPNHGAYVGRRFAVKTNRIHQTTGAGASGSYDYEELHQWVDGEEKSLVVTQNSAVINGVDWTPDPSGYGFIVSSPTTNTDTLQRAEFSGNIGYDFDVEFDESSATGKLLGTTHELLGMSISGSTNITVWSALGSPTAGESIHCPGHRLTP